MKNIGAPMAAGIKAVLAAESKPVIAKDRIPRITSVEPNSLARLGTDLPKNENVSSIPLPGVAVLMTFSVAVVAEIRTNYANSDIDDFQILAFPVLFFLLS